MFGPLIARACPKVYRIGNEAVRAEGRDLRAILVFTLLIAPTLAAGQDIEAGQRAYKVCGICHEVGPGAKAKIGPPLNGVFGRKAGSLASFVYSTAMRTSNIVWNDASFIAYIANPRASIRGTSMSFGGLDDQQQIEDLAAYLKQFDASGNIAAAPKAPAVPAAKVRTSIAIGRVAGLWGA